MSYYSAQEQEKLYWDIFRRIKLNDHDSVTVSLEMMKSYVGQSFALDSIKNLISSNIFMRLIDKPRKAWN